MFGDPQADLDAAAVALWQFFQNNAPDTASHLEVLAFQQAYVASGNVLHGTGGVYDGATADAFQTVLDNSPDLAQGVPEAAPQPAAGTAAPDLCPAVQAMTTSLSAHGYKQTDMGIYRTLQRALSAAGLYPYAIDGFPGQHTMGGYKVAATQCNITPATVKVYPWLGPEVPGGGVYDGVNAPSLSEWIPGSGEKKPLAPPVSPSGPNYALWGLGAFLAGVAGYFGYKSYKRRAH